jgi:transglutaminase-like putative cysteine protease
MKTPPLMLGAAALFWGWQTGLYIPAAIMAALMEGRRLTNIRVSLGLKEYRWIWNLCALVFLGAGVYAFTAGGGPAGFFTLIQWLPVIFLPMATAQVYGVSDKIEMAAFSLLFRNVRSRGPGDEPASANLTYPYLAMIIGAASAANVRSVWFYVFLGAVSMWALWTIRPKSYPAPLWAGSALMILAAGYASGVGLTMLQAIVEQRLVDFYARMFINQPDPFTTSSSIGEVGALKTSSKILYRVESPSGYTQPIYLPISSYNTYRLGSWRGMKSPLAVVLAEKNGLDWDLTDESTAEGGFKPAPAIAGSGRTLTVSTYLADGEGLLPIPTDATRLSRLPVHKMFMNRLGAVKVGGAPGFIRYDVRRGEGTARLAQPDGADLQVPYREEPWIARAALELGLAGKDPAEALQIIERRFSQGYTYTLDLKAAPGVSPLEGFFYHTRSGHCEYYAVTTVLLLRAAGVPARYFVGYLAHEYSPLERAFIVRQKDAHAWPMAFIGGRWIVFDTTPASWTEEDKTQGYALEGPYDLLSFLFLQFSKLKAGESVGFNFTWLAPLLIPMILYLAWRTFSGARLARTGVPEASEAPKAPVPGAASVFYLVERRLGELGFTRAIWETEAQFVRRILAHRPDLPKALALDLLNMHYRLRFDPKGLTPKENEEMIEATALWIEETRKATAPADAAEGK